MAGFSTGLSVFKAVYELSPIILNGGILGGGGIDFPGQMMPIIAFTEGVNFPFSILSSGDFPSFDRFFAHYQVLPGSSLVKQQIATYTFANATVAANAVIAEPLQVSLLMICPIQNKLGWTEKLGIITGLKWLFDRHNLLGGTYTILTPAYTYTNCVMRGMHDASSQLTKQVQNTFQLDFEKPLLLKSEVDSILSALGQVIKEATGPLNDPFGLGTSSTTSLFTSAIIPSSTQVIPAQQSIGPASFTGPSAQL